MAARFAFYAALAALLGRATYDAPGKFEDFETMAKCVFKAVTFSREVDALEAGVFNSLALHPMLAVAFLSRDGPRAWPFLALCFVGGMFALLPYLMFYRIAREEARDDDDYSPATSSSPVRGRLARFSRHRFYGVFVLGAALFLGVNAVQNGSFVAFRKAFETRAFVHVMTVDFVCFSLAAVDWLLVDTNYDIFKSLVFGCVPIIGPATYFALGLGEDLENYSSVVASPKESGIATPNSKKRTKKTI